MFVRTSWNITVGRVGSTVRDSLGDVRIGQLKGTQLTETPPTPLDPFELEFSRNTLDDLWQAVTWGASS